MAHRNFSARQSEVLVKIHSARQLAHRHRPPLPRPFPRESENLLGTFSPPGPSRVGRIAPPLAAPPRPLARRKVSPACRRVARRRGDALRSWNFAFVHSRLLVGRARSGKHVFRVTRFGISRRHVRFRWVDRGATWLRDDKAQPANVRPKIFTGAAFPVNAFAPETLYASRTLSACYATTTRVP